LIRIGHWTLVIAFFTAYFTEDDFMNLHAWAGYVVGIYLLIRIPYGFIGEKYARFSNFIYAATKIIGYLKNLATLKPQHYIGHNPAGGAMVITLLFSLSGTTLTGMKLYAIEENKGPFSIAEQQLQMQIPSVNLITEAKAEEDDDEEKYNVLNNRHETDKQAEEFWEELHELFSNFTLLLVFLHISGVIVSSYVDKENLIKAMFTGEKEIDDTYQ